MEKSVFDLRNREAGRIKYFKDQSLACTLLTIGMVPETRVIMMSRSPFGGAVRLKIGDTFIAIRDNEAKNIIID